MAAGNLTVTAALAVPGNRLRLQLFDATGATLLATGTAVRDGSGQVIRQTLTYPDHSGDTYLVRVLPGPAAVAGTPDGYTLDVQSLTANLGVQVYGAEAGSLSPGDQDYYALTAPAAGSLALTLTPGAGFQGDFHLEVLDQNSLSVLAMGQAAGNARLANLTVTQGQALYVRVFGAAGASGPFTLQFTNLDQFTTPDNRALFFPTGGDPCQLAVADLNHDDKPDIVVDYADQNFVSVLLNNGDGTFQAPRDYAVGAFQAGNNSSLGGLPDYKREMVIADFKGDAIPDIAVLNYQSDDLSLLLGHGDGTFAPQRVIQTLPSPFAIAAGDLNNDGITDLVVMTSGPSAAQTGEVLLGRGDGTFKPLIPFTIPNDPGGYPTQTIQIADLNHDGKEDLVYEGFTTFALLGNGDGAFGPAIPIGLGIQGALVVADLNGDGNPDVITSTLFTGNLAGYALGRGDGTFGPPVYVHAGQSAVGVAVADFGSPVTLPDGSTVLGPPDGHPDLVVADNGAPSGGVNQFLPQIAVVPGLVDAQGQFAGFGAPIPLATPIGLLDIKVADVNGDGVLDIAAAATGGVLVVYGQKPNIPPNTTPQSARKLGTVVHIVEPAQTIVPGHADSYFALTAPTEDAKGAGDEILDFSALFQAQGGAGLGMELRDANGRLLASGPRFRVRVPQGAALLLHVFGISGGTGAYTLDIDALPQLVSAQAEALLPGATAAPGGPVASVVLTFQGDRLDPDTAQDPHNYAVSYLGPDGVPSVLVPTAVAIQGTGGAQPAVYDPGANIDIATGKTYPTAVRQTVTLLFDQPLPAGDYSLALSPALVAAPFNPGEAALLASAPGITGHTVVSLDGGAVVEGDRRSIANLVPAGGALGDLAAFKAGTPFLTQLHDDLGALLDANLTRQGDAAGISAGIDDQIVGRFLPALGPAGERPFGVLVIWLDPVDVDLFAADRRGRASYDLRTDAYQNSFASAFVSVAGNVELLVVPLAPVGTSSYVLSVVPTASARGGVAYFGAEGGPQVQSLTADLRAGVSTFDLTYGTADAPPPARAVAPAAAPGPAALPGPEASLAVLVATSTTRAEQLPMTALVPIAVPVGGGGLAVTLAPAGGAAAGGNVPPVSLPGPSPPDPPPDPRVERIITALSGLVGRFLPALGPAVGQWLRALLTAPARGPRAALDPRPADVEVPAAPVVVEAPPEGVPAGVAPPAEEPGGGGSWAALLGLVGGFFLSGGTVARRDRRRRPEIQARGRPSRGLLE